MGDFSCYFSSLSLSSSLQPFTSRFPHLDVMIEDLNMNPTVAPPIPLPGQNVFRSSDNSYRCLECGCDQSFGAPESLKYQTSQRHIFHQNPNGGIYTSPAPSMTVPVNQVGAANPTIITSATMQRVSQPQDHLQPSPRSTTQKVFTASAYPPITTKHSHSTKQWADATAYSCAYSNYTCRD